MKNLAIHFILPHTPLYPASQLKDQAEIMVEGEPIHVMYMEETPSILWLSRALYNKFRSLVNDDDFDKIFREETQRCLWVPKFKDPPGFEGYMNPEKTIFYSNLYRP